MKGWPLPIVVGIFCLTGGILALRLGYVFLGLAGLIAGIGFIAGGLSVRIYRNRYLDLILNKNYDSIQNIVSILGRQDIQLVMDEIQQIIDAGFLPELTVDRENLRLIKTASARADNVLQI